MNSLSERTDDFLKSIDMHPDQTDPERFVRDFLSEMDAGLAGEASSLKMIPTYVSADGTPQDGESVIAIDAGGTNLRVSRFATAGRRSCASRKAPCPAAAAR